MRRVLVLQLARFGDLVQTKRLLLSLAAGNETETHLCVDVSLGALARLIYPFAVIHTLPAHAGEKNPAAVLSQARAALSRLRNLDFAEVYPLNFSPLSFACASIFAPEQLRGYARVKGQDMRGKRIALVFRLMRDRRFSPLNLADLWANFCSSPLPPEKVNPIPVPAGTSRIGLIMAGRESRRSLPPSELALCLQAIFQARGGPDIVCIGSKTERPLVRQLLRNLPARTQRKIADTTGATSLTDLPDLLSGLDLVLTPDTGAMHLSAHLGIPVQAFFLSSAWCWETGPYGFGHTVWQSLRPCSPCREGEACAKQTACLSPFSHKAFLAHLAGRRTPDWPEDLLGLVTVLDDTGASCKLVDGGDPYTLARTELRNGIAACFGRIGTGEMLPRLRHELAEFLYAEKDWMLPADWDAGGAGGQS